MSREEDKQKLILVIKKAHAKSKLDTEIQEIFIEAIKGLKSGDLPSYVSYILVNKLSGYYMRHVG